MRELPVRLPRHEPAPQGGPWREAFFFLASFLATLGASTLMLEHAAAVLA